MKKDFRLMAVAFVLLICLLAQASSFWIFVFTVITWWLATYTTGIEDD